MSMFFETVIAVGSSGYGTHYWYKHFTER